MIMSCGDELARGNKEMPSNEKLSRLTPEQEDCDNVEKEPKVEEMDEVMEEIGEDDLNTILTTEIFDEIDKMIEEKEMSFKDPIMMLKRAGYWKVLKYARIECFEDSPLNKRFEEMIIDENEKKKEEKNEKFLIDICECYLLLNGRFDSELFSVCIPCLLKVALNKEESKETKKERDIALFSLSNVRYRCIDKELYLNEIKEVIQHYQERHDLTRLAYQSAWQFLIDRLSKDKSLEEVIANELHFAREAARELEELVRNVNWKRKDIEKGEEKEEKEILIIRRWLFSIHNSFIFCKLWNDEYVGLIGSITGVFRAFKGYNSGICYQCRDLEFVLSKKTDVKIDDLLKEGAIDLFMVEMKQTTLKDGFILTSLWFLMNIIMRLKVKEKEEMEAAKRKGTKRKVFEWMEEEGFEDSIVSFHEVFDFMNIKYDYFLSEKFYDFLVNA
ncbi:uncharacterized protein MONOS_1847 [Monocercomonoides exilis]|uniref:uncharacterized protein n=1 Tax=Monocercomonoides exilis TaxID=2049356 RepID=UPI00355A5645|nr:hypothetical protein MONOS_1847 [Monocercomonoides exilis]|eukprot:MONOS_1847.1-p1 / transcript=MONOS_1847.1 / gene=MONOS_1847 / organism=Monocercomonoides_exilis_PA203 / gene_product=unspecified product / transcript_product=unspecified product / location=Mono_scaffold00035:25520-26975(-) / protein_length=444 / sequence_SO=supercontig / SO=protein_coding / is_pseudo=false